VARRMEGTLLATSQHLLSILDVPKRLAIEGDEAHVARNQVDPFRFIDRLLGSV